MWWWLSFCDPGKPSGERFLGACIVEAPDHRTAIMEAHRLGINPGGEVAGKSLPEGWAMKPEYVGRFYPVDEAHAIAALGLEDLAVPS